MNSVTRRITDDVRGCRLSRLRRKLTLHPRSTYRLISIPVWCANESIVPSVRCMCVCMCARLLWLSSDNVIVVIILIKLYSSVKLNGLVKRFFFCGKTTTVGARGSGYFIQDLISLLCGKQKCFFF